MPRNPHPPAREISGALLVDKPSGMTSHDVVARLRRAANMRRIGHCGTLDPLASGLLLVCIGGATRAAQFLVGLTKEYTGVIRFGAVSSTYDAEGDIVEQEAPPPRMIGDAEAAMREQLGFQMQLPPPYSAVKVKGKKLYEYARRGEEAPLEARKVHIMSFEALEYRAPELRFRSRVGSGTYIRSMAHDLGVRLGCGGYLASLRRTRVGQFDVEDALPLAALEAEPDVLESRLLSLPEVLTHLPKVTVPPSVEAAVLHGRAFTTGEILSSEALPRADEPVLVLSETGAALSVARGEAAGGAAENSGAEPLVFRPIRVLGQP